MSGTEPIQPLTVEVTAEDIAQGERGNFNTHPLLAALARSLGETSLDVIYDEEDDPYVRLGNGRRIGLPRRCHYFLRSWEYGPMGGQPLAIRSKAGEIVAMRPFAEIVQPFSFTLEAT